FRNMLYNETVGALATEKIIEEIGAIVTKYSAEYPGLKFDVSQLSFTSLDTFACSYLIELKNIKIPD
ncbi:MAG: hypothetical protein J6T96_12645, partial [Bacteroidales bacterium]|nr:hypothetical protein [Bacteroidales bacterium]